jgi:hypothetical protein
MMTREMVMAQVDALGEDASYYVDRDGDLHVTLDDFGGYDEDWCEIDREYDDEEAVEAFLDLLEAEASEVSGDFYRYYQMDGFTVVVGCSSMDI